MTSHKYKGITMVVAGSVCWGLSGTVAQMLFQHEGFQPGWLVSVRMTLSGLLLLLLGLLQPNKQQIWQVWKTPKDAIQLIVFGLIGMLGVQYTYFAAIQEANAATATLLQYSSPVMIVLYLAMRLRQIPLPRELTALLLAMLGTFLLVTSGSFDQLSITGAALFWGLASAVTAAFYSLYPAQLLQKFSSAVIVGWGMLIGGIGLSLINPPWQVHGQNWSPTTILAVAFIIVFGTLIAFYLYLDSLRFITASEASVLASAEPLSAAVASILWLHVPFGIYEILGGLCIIGTVVTLSWKPLKQRKTIRTVKAESPQAVSISDRS